MRQIQQMVADTSPALAPPIPAMLQQKEFQAPRWIAWWYALSAPQPPARRQASTKEREMINRGRFGSILLAVQLVFIELPVVPVVWASPNHAVVLPWLLGCIMALFVAMFFNRKGLLIVTGLLMVASIEVTVSIKILTVPGGIGLFNLPQLDILVQPILLAVALLPPWSAFVVAAYNIGFVLFVLLAGPHAPDLTLALRSPSQVGDLFAVPIMTQLLAAFFSWIIVRNLLKAFVQINRAEQVATLEHQIAEQRRLAEMQSQQLSVGIAAMIQTIQQVSNGQWIGPIPLSPQNVLWPIKTQLDHLCQRYRQRVQAEAELALTRTAIDEFSSEIYQAKQHHRKIGLPPRRGTLLDAVLIALSSETQEAHWGESSHSQQR